MSSSSGTLSVNANCQRDLRIFNYYIRTSTRLAKILAKGGGGGVAAER